MTKVILTCSSRRASWSRACLTPLALPSCRPVSVGRIVATKPVSPLLLSRFMIHGWRRRPTNERRIALDAAMASGLTRIQGRDNERAQCRDLTLFGSPLPTASAAVHTLTLEQVEALGVVPPSTTGASSRPRRASLPPRSQSIPAASRRPRQRSRAPPRAIAPDPPDLPVVTNVPPSSPDGGGSPDRRLAAKRSPSRSVPPPREASRSPPATVQRVAEL
jgi:hypothetical protein